MFRVPCRDKGKEPVALRQVADARSNSQRGTGGASFEDVVLNFVRDLETKHEDHFLKIQSSGIGYLQVKSAAVLYYYC